jgi:hypothetical protein
MDQHEAANGIPCGSSVTTGSGEDTGRRAALLRQGLADRVVARLLEELLQLQEQALAALAVLLLALAQDLERGVGESAGG